MNRQANGIGSYKRRKSPSGSTAISPERQARMDVAHFLSLQRASAGTTPVQVAAVYKEGQAGLTASMVEVTV